jgi:hypothetical protein
MKVFVYYLVLIRRSDTVLLLSFFGSGMLHYWGKKSQHILKSPEPVCELATNVDQPRYKAFAYTSRTNVYILQHLFFIHACYGYITEKNGFYLSNFSWRRVHFARFLFF